MPSLFLRQRPALHMPVTKRDNPTRRRRVAEDALKHHRIGSDVPQIETTIVYMVRPQIGRILWQKDACGHQTIDVRTHRCAIRKDRMLICVQDPPPALPAAGRFALQSPSVSLMPPSTWTNSPRPRSPLRRLRSTRMRSRTL